MTETPESKALRALVTAIKKGQKPDIAAAETLLAGNAADEDYCSRKWTRAHNRIVRQCRAAGQRVMRTDEAVKLQREYAQLIAERDLVDYRACNKLIASLGELYQAARAGKLTKKQFDKAIKDLCK